MTVFDTKGLDAAEKLLKDRWGETKTFRNLAATAIEGWCSAVPPDLGSKDAEKVAIARCIKIIDDARPVTQDMTSTMICQALDDIVQRLYRRKI